nr:probable proteasome inhibitor isoform X2 [Arachis hypogaea]
MVSDKTVLAVIRASRPTFRNQNDKIAFAVHSSFLASGYVLTATGSQALSDTALSNSSNEEVAVDHWNELNDEYAFVYANPERGSKKVLLKCLVMNEILLVDALSEGSSEPVHLDINVGEYAGEDGGSNYSQQFKNLDKLVKIIDGDILSKFDGSANASSSNKRSETTERQEIHETGTRFGDPAIPPNHPVGIAFPPVSIGSGSDLFPGTAAGMYPSSIINAEFNTWIQGLMIPVSSVVLVVSAENQAFLEDSLLDLIHMVLLVFLVLSLTGLQGILVGQDMTLIQICNISGEIQIQTIYSCTRIAFLCVCFISLFC